jgi:hypothetical protein
LACMWRCLISSKYFLWYSKLAGNVVCSIFFSHFLSLCLIHMSWAYLACGSKISFDPWKHKLSSFRFIWCVHLFHLFHFVHLLECAPL